MKTFLTIYLLVLFAAPIYIVVFHSYKRWPHIRLWPRTVAIVTFDKKKMREWDRDAKMMKRGR